MLSRNPLGGELLHGTRQPPPLQMARCIAHTQGESGQKTWFPPPSIAHPIFPSVALTRRAVRGPGWARLAWNGKRRRDKESMSPAHSASQFSRQVVAEHD